MKWSQQAWKAAEPAYKRILELEFIRDLLDGALDRGKFIFYLRQDAIYLSAFGKAMAGIAAKLEKPEHSQAFIRFAGDTIQVERDMQAAYLNEENTPEAEASPTCLLYTSYMLRQLYEAPAEVALAAVLPCFWVYKEVGDYILAGRHKKDNPYQAWIDTYGGDEYGKAVLEAIAICDEVAAACTEKQREAMTRAYVNCTRMEWMFWDSAYKLEQWPV